MNTTDLTVQHASIENNPGRRRVSNTYNILRGDNVVGTVITHTHEGSLPRATVEIDGVGAHFQGGEIVGFGLFHPAHVYNPETGRSITPSPERIAFAREVLALVK